ncbi:autotransporter assembly complex family protein [Roseateles sp.]|jgi:translocation and assembly module TamA|uniref:autotransporter assembly complex family protein n=1 Tax=Roseateles sp. TaxID=1971397 RepID=UPI0037CB23B8
MTPRALGALLLGASCVLLSGCASLSALLGGASPVPRSAAASDAPQKLAYELEVRAPGELRALLLQHLDLARFRLLDEGQALSASELARLATAAPAQARSLLETEGYFEPLIELRRESGPVERLIVSVDPGPRVIINAVQIDFSGALQPPEGDAPPADAAERQRAERLRAELQRSWGLPEGRPFRQSDWSSAKTALLTRSRASGYPLARLALSDAELDTESRRAVLRLSLDSGPLFRLGEIRIEGLQHQPPSTVLRLADFRPGTPYSEKLLLDFQERLQATLLFDRVSVELDSAESGSASAPVLVRLREAPRQQATTGLGFNANTGQRVTLEHLHRKPFGLDMRSRSKIDFGRDLRSAELELTSHPQTDMQRNLGSLAFEEDRSSSTINTSLIGRLGRLREHAQDERLIYLELIRSRERNGALSTDTGALSINSQWTRRRVDDKLLPTDGHTAWLQLGLGRADNSGGINGAFGRAQIKLGWYRPLPKGWHSELHLDAAQVLVKGGIAMPDRLLFRAGGDNSVRGYAYRSLGPTVGGREVGGRALLTGSAELAHPISKSYPGLWGAVFVDAGDAAENFGALKPVLGYGAGLRVRSPVGSLRLDLARGHELGRWRLHFSVGIAL